MSVFEQAIALLSEMVAHPTVSDRPNRALAELLAERLVGQGARVSLFPDASGDKANLVASFGPQAEGGLMLSGHLDVVPPGEGWSSDPFQLRRAEGRLYGRGTCDMKGFNAACVAMAPRFATCGAPVHLVFTQVRVNLVEQSPRSVVLGVLSPVIVTITTEERLHHSPVRTAVVLEIRAVYFRVFLLLQLDLAVGTQQ